MADLDDFFAKKDKKKSKVKKFTASELLTSSKFQQGEDVAAAPTGVPKKQPSEKPKKEETSETGDSDNVPVKSKPTEGEEEEWGEFEQEKERDYSGLKIQKLQIQDSEEDDDEDSGEQELNEEGELVKKEPAGPWNKINAQPTSNAKAKESIPVETTLPNTAGGVYVPPSKRNQPAGGGSSNMSGSSRSRTGKKDKGAPDMNNEESFPTLSAAVAIEQNNFKLKRFEQTERGFTEAKPSRSHSNRNAPGPGEEGPRLNLGNKFNALSNDDS